MKVFMILSVLVFFHSFARANEFQDSAAAFASQASVLSQQISEELSFVEKKSRSAKFFMNEIVVKVQPELGASVGVVGLKFAFSMEFTATRKLPANLELNNN